MAYIHRWELHEEPEGAVVRDKVGNWNMTSSNTTFNGEEGHNRKGAFYFNGNSNSYLSAGTNKFISSEGTISLWFKFSNNTSGTSLGLLANVNNDENAGSIKLRKNGTDDKIWFTLIGTTEVTIKSNDDFIENDWVHLVVTWKDSNNMKMYINNVLQSDMINFNYQSPYATNELFIGKYQRGSAYMDGYIEDVRMFNNELNSSQINLIYQDKYDGTKNGTAEVGTGTAGTRIMDKNYPYEEGLIAGTTKQTGSPNL